MIERELVNKADRLRIIDNIRAEFIGISDETLERLLNRLVSELFESHNELFLEDLHNENKLLEEELGNSEDRNNELHKNAEDAYNNLETALNLLDDLKVALENAQGMLE